MAGTDKQRGLIPEGAPLGPAIILVRPQLGENIGMCARAMLNCGVEDLRLVAPRDGWPNPAADKAASGALVVLERAKIYATTAEAIADLEVVFATTARERGMVKEIHSPASAATLIRATNQNCLSQLAEEEAGGASPAVNGQQKCGVLFGPERTGLENDDIALANAILNIPLNPGFSSLNLAQAVLLTCYGWLSQDNHFAQGEKSLQLGETQPATRGEVENLMQRLEEELVAGAFFRSPDQKPTILRNLRNFFFRSGATQQEVRTFHGVISCLTDKKNKKERA